MLNTVENKGKYYVPEITEFHVGFEYEFKETFLDGTVKTQEEYDKANWYPDHVDNGFQISYINRAVNGVNNLKGLSGVRVKYLDKEDIESLGFKYIPNSNVKDSLWYNRFSSAYALFGTTFNWITADKERDKKGHQFGITLYVDNIIEPTYIRIDGEVAPGAVYGHMGSCMFRGYVKNKSGLKQVLKMIGVEYEKNTNS